MDQLNKQVAGKKPEEVWSFASLFLQITGLMLVWVSCVKSMCSGDSPIVSQPNSEAIEREIFEGVWT